MITTVKTTPSRSSLSTAWLLTTAWLLAAVPLLAAAQPSAAPEPATTAGSAAVQLYVLPNCGYCERARAHLRERGQLWQEFDIAADPAHLARFKALGGQGTPLLQVGERVLHGYVPQQLDAALAALR